MRNEEPGGYFRLASRRRLSRRNLGGRLRSDGRQGESKILHGIVIADISDHRAYHLLVVGQLSSFHFAAQEVTQDAPKILMARKRHEGTRVRRHAHEARQQSAVRQCIQLPLDTFLLVKKPPGATKLELACQAAVLEVADHGGKNVIVGRVKVIKNHLWQPIFPVQSIQIIGERSGLPPIANRIKSGVPPQPTEHTRIGIAIGAEVQLFCPAFLGVEAAEEQHEKAGELGGFEGCWLAAAAHFLKDLLRLALGTGLGIAEIYTVIGEPASVPVEIVVAFAESLKHVRDPRYIKIAYPSQLVDPLIEGNRIFGSQRPIGTEARQNPYAGTARRNSFMILE